MTTRDDLNRTAKVEIDSGRAQSLEEAEAILRSYILQVVVAPGAMVTATGRATLMTIVNAGLRCFLGGVRVSGDLGQRSDWPFIGQATARDVVVAFGGTVDEQVTDLHPTVVIGDADARGSVVVHATWDGWSGGVVTRRVDRLAERPLFPPAGVAAGAIAVSETFQHVRGLVVAGRRDVGLSLWRPDVDWRSPAAAGDQAGYAPDRWWLLGLGHLGQAYAWNIAMLPYDDPAAVCIWLQDIEDIVKANVSTSLLATSDHVGKPKVRVIGAALERHGFRTRHVERLFDERTQPAESEPPWAVAGFDSPNPRRLLGNFDAAFDGGLGSAADSYLELAVHAFPAEAAPADAFRTSAPSRNPRVDLPAYEQAVQDAIAGGSSEGEARCGVLEIAGAAVGAAFVGALAGSLIVASAVRALIDGPRYDVVSLSLRDPNLVATAPASAPTPPACGFTLLTDS